MKKIVIKIIKFYQYFSRTVLRHNTLPFFFSPVCRFYPSCSDYSVEVINKYGFWRGIGKSLVRILKCNPFYKGQNTL